MKLKLSLLLSVLLSACGGSEPQRKASCTSDNFLNTQLDLKYNLTEIEPGVSYTATCSILDHETKELISSKESNTGKCLMQIDNLYIVMKEDGGQITATGIAGAVESVNMVCEDTTE